jgi:hypothetical protein
MYSFPAYVRNKTSVEITVPSSASGNYRMRIRNVLGNNPDPCSNISSGETEDYSINITGAAADCNGVESGTAYIDDCNNCVGGNTGLEPCQATDCNGDMNGTAYEDRCGTCVGGNTGLTECTVPINALYDNFEDGMGNWINGDKNAKLYTRGTYAPQGTNSASLKESTFITTGDHDFSGISEISVDFSYITSDMESGDNFQLQVSTDGGATFTTVDSWAYGTDFTNENVFATTVIVTGITFSYQTQLRFTSNANDRKDMLYLDEIQVTLLTGIPEALFAANQRFRDDLVTSIKDVSTETIEANLLVYPNPVIHKLNVEITGFETTDKVNVNIYNMLGEIVQTQTFTSSKFELDLDVSPGTYLLRVNTNDQMFNKKILVK